MPCLFCRLAAILTMLALVSNAPIPSGAVEPRPSLPSPPVSHSTETVQVHGRAMHAEIVRVRLDSVRMQVGLAHGKVGATEPLGEIAARSGALAAINGSFFAAYDWGAIKAPDQTLITGGRVVHIGSVGSIVGFDAAGECRIGRVQWAIRGTRDGRADWPHSWFAYWLNRPVTASTITIYDHFWPAPTTPAAGTAVVVKDGVVTAIQPGPAPIPDGDGYVIYFKNAEPGLLSTFAVGQRPAYSVVPRAGADPFWNRVREGVGAGPLLVDGGRVVVLDAAAEGFVSPKILTQSGSRSAAGVTANGTLLLLATSGTLAQEAALMQALGCAQAMNLDGGASSGLWLDGSYLRQPGRQLSNALLVLPK